MKLIKSKITKKMCAKSGPYLCGTDYTEARIGAGLATGSTPIGMYEELVRKYNEDRVGFRAKSALSTWTSTSALPVTTTRATDIL